MTLTIDAYRLPRDSKWVRHVDFSFSPSRLMSSLTTVNFLGFDASMHIYPTLKIEYDTKYVHGHLHSYRATTQGTPCC